MAAGIRVTTTATTIRAAVIPIPTVITTAAVTVTVSRVTQRQREVIRLHQAAATVAAEVRLLPAAVQVRQPGRQDNGIAGRLQGSRLACC